MLTAEQQLTVAAFGWLTCEGPLAGRAVQWHMHAGDDPASPWAMVVALGGPAARFAIWRATGAVHRVQESGDPFPEAVEDDPIWTPGGGPS